MAYDAGRAFERIEHRLIASMMRNLSRHLAQEQALGFDWSQWQVEQLKYLEQYRRENARRFPPQFAAIHQKMLQAIAEAEAKGQKAEERNILGTLAANKALHAQISDRAEIAGDAFFRVNDRKLDSLLDATENDLQRAEYAVLRRANDRYRQIIFDAQVYANTGAGTVQQAVDMATKDFLSRGIDSIVYKNGARHTISDYADMYIRTAERRAYLMGEGRKRQEWGLSLVIVNRRGGHPCPQCAKWIGQVLVDDVYSGGKPDGKHTLLSEAMAQGFLHPRCKDGFTTYFPGVTSVPDPVSEAERRAAERAERQENRERYAGRQAEKYERLAEYSLDPDNRRRYRARAGEWETQYSTINQARPLDAIYYSADEDDAQFTKQDILSEMQTSPVGRSAIEHIRDSDVRIQLIVEKQWHPNRGEQRGNEVRIFLSNIKNKRVAAQTIIHEMTHYWYQIGHCQHAEAVCFAMEKMHITGRDYLTQDEWQYVKQLAIDNYPEYNWEKGGDGDYEQFDFVK